jgi:hypothetical protein
MQALNQLQAELPIADRTIILYDIYASPDALPSLHAFAQLLLDPAIPVSLTRKKRKGAVQYSYSVAPQHAEHISRREVQLEGEPRKEGE